MPFNYVVPVGLPVHYYRTVTDSQPEGAAITHINEDGIADVVTIPRHGGTLTPKRGVRHISDPWHKENPDVSRNYGAWDFMPEVEEKKPEPKPKQSGSK